MYMPRMFIISNEDGFGFLTFSFAKRIIIDPLINIFWVTLLHAQLQARSMLYKEAINVLGAAEAKVYYNSIKSPGVHVEQKPSLLESSLTSVTCYHPVTPPRRILVHICKLIMSSSSVRDAFEPLIAWLVAYAADC